MSKYIDADKLIAEIEQELSAHNKVDHLEAQEVGKAWSRGHRRALEEMLDFITSLQQEQLDKYETALEKARGWMSNINQGGHAMLIDIFPELGEGLDPRYGGRKQKQPECGSSEKPNYPAEWSEEDKRKETDWGVRHCAIPPHGKLFL